MLNVVCSHATTPLHTPSKHASNAIFCTHAFKLELGRLTTSSPSCDEADNVIHATGFDDGRYSTSSSESLTSRTFVVTSRATSPSHHHDNIGCVSQRGSEQITKRRPVNVIRTKIPLPTVVSHRIATPVTVSRWTVKPKIRTPSFPVKRRNCGRPPQATVSVNSISTGRSCTVARTSKIAALGCQNVTTTTDVPVYGPNSSVRPLSRRTTRGNVATRRTLDKNDKYTTVTRPVACQERTNTTCLGVDARGVDPNETRSRDTPIKRKSAFIARSTTRSNCVSRHTTTPDDLPVSRYARTSVARQRLPEQQGLRRNVDVPSPSDESTTVMSPSKAPSVDRDWQQSNLTTETAKDRLEYNSQETRSRCAQCAGVTDVDWWRHQVVPPRSYRYSKLHRRALNAVVPECLRQLPWRWAWRSDVPID